MNIETHIEEIRAANKNKHFAGEASVSLGIVLRLLNTLGWSIFNPCVVFPEYQLPDKTRVDYALFNCDNDKPIIFIEVKKKGQGEKEKEQLFKYVSHENTVVLAILVDCNEWSFFLSDKQSRCDNECFIHKLNIMQDDLSKCAKLLTRYLLYDAVISGEAIEKIRKDYDIVCKSIIKTEPPIGFTLNGTHYSNKDVHKLRKRFFEAIIQRDPEFAELFSASCEYLYLAKTPEELNCKPNLRQYSKKLELESDDWWINTGRSCPVKKTQEIIKMACEFAGLQYSENLII